MIAISVGAGIVLLAGVFLLCWRLWRRRKSNRKRDTTDEAYPGKPELHAEDVKVVPAAVAEIGGCAQQTTVTAGAELEPGGLRELATEERSAYELPEYTVTSPPPQELAGTTAEQQNMPRTREEEGSSSCGPPLLDIPETEAP